MNDNSNNARKNIINIINKLQNIIMEYINEDEKEEDYTYEEEDEANEENNNYNNNDDNNNK